MQPGLLIPEFGQRRQGKVRDIYEAGKNLFLVASDRISIFDRILQEPIPDKGRILTELALFWFENTKDLIRNHVVSHPDPNVLLVEKCTPIPIEVIVRGYAAGSLWRDYAKGSRCKCGVTLPENIQQNDPLPSPIVTPSTKNHFGHDEDITPQELIGQKIVTQAQWEEIEKTALALYQRGNEILHKRGMILVDTKYEFGWNAQGQLTLIDEIHTPDSSRFWFQQDVAKKEVRFLDKELVRIWAKEKGFAGEGALPKIPEEMQQKIRCNYKELFETITGKTFTEDKTSFSKRLVTNLKKQKLIKGSFVLIVLGSEKDLPFTEKMCAHFAVENIPYLVEVASAHKHTHKLLQLLELYNESCEPMVCLTLAGRSNALSGVVASHSKWPVIACPVFKDLQEYQINIHSTLQMPSNVPVLTVLDPVNAALAATRILQTMEMQL